MSKKTEILSYQPTEPLCRVSIDNTGFQLIAMYPTINRDNAYSILDKTNQIILSDTECAITVRRSRKPSDYWQSYFINRGYFSPEEAFILTHYAIEATRAIPLDYQEINPGLITLVSIVSSEKMPFGAKHQAINAIAELGLNSASDPDRHYAVNQLFDLYMVSPPRIARHIKQVQSGQP